MSFPRRTDAVTVGVCVFVPVLDFRGGGFGGVTLCEYVRAVSSST